MREGYKTPSLARSLFGPAPSPPNIVFSKGTPLEAARKINPQQGEYESFCIFVLGPIESVLVLVFVLVLPGKEEVRRSSAVE